MFCSSCGVAVSDLTYCNHCGARLNRAETKSAEVRPESLIFGMIATFVFGLIAIAVLLGVMKTVLGLETGQILGFAMLLLLIMVVLEAVFIRLLLRRNRSVDTTSDKALSEGQPTNELDAGQPRVLPEGVPSVTEHTTRVLEPVRR